MKKFKQILAALLGGVLIAGSLSACGGEAPKTSSADTPPAGEPASQVETDPTALKGTVNVWTWEPYENQKDIIGDFNKAYPGITVEFTTVNGGDMPMKLQTALASDSDIPDVVWCEISNRGKMMSLDCWEDLGTAPYSIDRADMLEYQIPVSETPSGKLAGIEVSTPVAGLAYKRGLAKEYFGTDDPDELSAMLSTWDDMIEKGKEVSEKSGGTVKLFLSPSDPFGIISGQNKEPHVVDNKLNLSASVGDALDKVIEMRASGIVDTIQGDTPAYDAAIAGDNHIFFNCPTWAPTWVFKAKDPEGTGDWGLMLPPGGGYMNGGTVTAIPQKSQNKDLAFAYIKWNYFTKEGAVSNRDHLDYMTPYKPVYQDESFYSVEDEFFGGQDVLKTFAQVIIPKTTAPRPVHKYDMEVNDAIQIALKTVADGNATREQLIKDMSAEIIGKVPELTAE